MTASEVRGYLKVGANTLRKFRAMGLRHIKVDRKVFFRRRDVDAFMDRFIVEPKNVEGRRG